MSEPTPASFGDNKDTWRTATLVTGFALLISMAAHFGGPSSATASDAPINELARTQALAAQSLSIGGFTTLDNQPAFVILNAQGQRIGALPMNAAMPEPSADEPES
jgi:hypothetical protein